MCDQSQLDLAILVYGNPANLCEIFSSILFIHVISHHITVRLSTANRNSHYKLLILF